MALFSVVNLLKINVRARCVSNRVICMVYTLIAPSPEPISAREFRHLLSKNYTVYTIILGIALLLPLRV